MFRVLAERVARLVCLQKDLKALRVVSHASTMECSAPETVTEIQVCTLLNQQAHAHLIESTSGLMDVDGLKSCLYSFFGDPKTPVFTDLNLALCGKLNCLF